MSLRRLSGAFAIATLAMLAAVGCGHTEQEWQAQLSKYEKLEERTQLKERRLEEVGTALELEKRKVGQLEKELRSLGIDLADRERQVSNLASSLDEREKALEEYRLRASQLALIKTRFELLKKKLEALSNVGLAVSVRKNRMVISLPGDVLFDTGKETLKKDGKDVLTKVAAVLQGDPALLARDYQVAGHTDGKPLKGGRFQDNWGLSLARSREVLLFLTNAKGGALPAAHWSAVGFAENDPVAPNDTEEGRQKNRRCELIVVPSVEEMLDLRALANEP
jgi:chemotaxis protein MotB